MLKNMVFIFFIIINNINSISLDNSNRKQNMNYQKFCKNNPNNFYCVHKSFLYTIFIINSILIFIACVYILIIIVRKRIRENQIRTIYLITNTINNNYELKKKNLLENKIKYIIKNEIKKINFSQQKFNQNEICSICLGKYDEKNDICITPCKHYFHFFCLYQYIIQSKDTSCPLCKFNYLNVLKGKNIDFNKMESEEFNIIKINESYENINHVENNDYNSFSINISYPNN
jgi:hypothetical protein